MILVHHRQALTILREFYAKAAEATAFVQKPYKGMGDSNTGVVGMLEVSSPNQLDSLHGAVGAH